MHGIGSNGIANLIHVHPEVFYEKPCLYHLFKYNLILAFFFAKLLVGFHGYSIDF